MRWKLFFASIVLFSPVVVFGQVLSLPTLEESLAGLTGSRQASSSVSTQLQAELRQSRAPSSIFQQGPVDPSSVLSDLNSIVSGSPPITDIASTTRLDAQLSTSTPPSATDLLLAQLFAQLKRVLAQIDELRQSQASTATSSSALLTDDSSCPVFERNLRFGDTDANTGGDVSRLQQFLALDNSVYLEGDITGRFDVHTESAVDRWQIKYNIVTSGTPDTTGFGILGPKTREVMAHCVTRAPH